MVKSTVFKGDDIQLMRCILVLLFQAPAFNIFISFFLTIYWIVDRSPGALSVLLSLARFDFALFRPESMATERRSLVTCVLKSSTASLAEITRLDYLPQFCKSKMWGDELIIRGTQLFSDIR